MKQLVILFVICLLIAFSSLAQVNHRAAATKVMAEHFSRVGIDVSKDCSNTGSQVLELSIRWKAYPSSRRYIPPDSEQHTPGGGFKVTHRRKVDGPLVRPRSAELSADQLVIAGLDGQLHLCSWTVVPDPLTVRAEEPARPTGALKGRVLHRTEADFVITLADDPTMTELRFYRPHWSGNAFDLQLLGSARFDNSGGAL